MSISKVRGSLKQTGDSITLNDEAANNTEVKHNPASSGAVVTTLPETTDTVVGRNTADVLTNKTIDADAAGNDISNLDDTNIKAGAAIDASKIGNGDVDNTELSALSGVSGTLVDTTTLEAHTLNDNTHFLVEEINHDATLGAVGKQTHTQIDAALAAVNAVDNTSDADKPVSTATQTALDLKADQTEVTANTNKVSADGSIDSHSDIDITTSSPNTNDVLEWDGTKFVPAAPSGGGGATELNDLTDVRIVGTPSANDFLRYDDGMYSAFVPATINTRSMVDVENVSPSDGDVLVYNTSNAQYEPQAPTAGTPVSTVVTSTLADNISAPTDVTGLVFNGATEKTFTTELATYRKHSQPATSLDHAFYSNLPFMGSSSASGSLEIPGSGGDILIYGNMGTASGGVMKVDSTGNGVAAFNSNLPGPTVTNVQCAAVQNDGKILLGGYFTNVGGTPNFSYLIRLNTDGTLDSTFSTTLLNSGTGLDNSVLAVAVLPDQTIVIGGTFTTLDGTTTTLGVAKISSAGTQITSFNTNLGALSITASTEAVHFIEVDTSDSSIILCGSSSTTGFDSVGGNARKNIIKVDYTGSEVASFHSTLVASYPTALTFTSVFIDAAGKYIISEDGDTINRTDSSGIKDTSFSAGSITGIGRVGQVADAGGGGYYMSSTGASFSYDGNTIKTAAKISPTGSVDLSFEGNVDTLTAVLHTTVLANGKLIFTGTFSNIAYSDSNPGTLNVKNVVQISGAGGVIEALKQSTLRGTYSEQDSTWLLSETTYSDSGVGVSYTITSVGQVQYTSTAISGSIVESYAKHDSKKI